jgi:hypothetical protein
LTNPTLDQFYNNLVTFLEESKSKYVIIGGLAVSLIGEPRLTHDIDLILSIPESDIQYFLKLIIDKGFDLNMQKELKRIERTGTFRFSIGFFHADVILASSTFEDSVFKRRRRIKLVDKKAYFPSPEDLIILKIMVGREKDMLDAKSIVIRHKNKLDKKYIEKWTQKISDEAQDMTIWNRLSKLFSDVGF